MSARDELTTLILGKTAPRAADAILAAGYTKPRTVTLWGVSFVHNGAFYKEYSTREEAQAFADEMTEVGAHMVVVTREHTPAVYGEWEPTA